MISCSWTKTISNSYFEKREPPTQLRPGRLAQSSCLDRILRRTAGEGGLDSAPIQNIVHRVSTLQTDNSGFGSSKCPFADSDTVCVVIFRILFDIALNVAAGAAAAAAGAHANGNAVTPRVTQLGAIAGLTKSAITGSVWTIGLLDLKLLSSLLILGSGLGVCLLVTVEIANIILGKSTDLLTLRRRGVF